MICFRFLAFSFAGAEFGNVIALPLCGYLSETIGWESVFYVCGALGVVWFIFWSLLVYDGPELHPRITPEEAQFLQLSLSECESKKPSKIPWKQIITSAPVWAIAVTHVTQSFGFYVLFTELPTYMKNVLNWDLKTKVNQKFLIEFFGLTLQSRVFYLDCHILPCGQ